MSDVIFSNPTRNHRITIVFEFKLCPNEKILTSAVCWCNFTQANMNNHL